MNFNANSEPSMYELRRAHADAAAGSEALRHAMRQEFGKLALQRGILVSDARLLLMNGVGL